MKLCRSAYKVLIFGLLTARAYPHQQTQPSSKESAGQVRYQIDSTDKSVLFRKPQESLSLNDIASRATPEPLGWFQAGVVGISGEIGDWTVDWLKSKLIAPLKESCKFEVKNEYIEELRKENPRVGDRARSIIERAVDLASRFCSSDVQNLSLNSVGGSVETGETIGWAMRIAGIEVKIPKGGICSSACIGIFQRAKTRLAANGTSFMFHMVTLGKEKLKELVYDHKLLPADFQQIVLDGKELYLSSQVAMDIGLVTEIFD